MIRRMLSTRAARRLSAWIAIVAMLAAVLMPAASHALPGADPFGPICSVAGDRLPAPEPASPAGQAHEHCVLCASQAGGAALPPAQRPLVFAGRARPPLFETAPAEPRARPLLSPARPRAPPAVS